MSEVKSELSASLSSFVYSWNITNITSFAKSHVTTVVKSEEFCTTHDNVSTKWCLQLTKTIDHKEHFSISIECLANFPVADVFITFGFLNSNAKEVINQRKIQYKFSKNNNTCTTKDFIEKKIISENSMNVLVKNNLTIICTIQFRCSMIPPKLQQVKYKDLFTKNTEDTKISQHTDSLGDIKEVINVVPNATDLLLSDVSNLSENMKKLFIDKKYCDVYLEVGNKKIKAHKLILASRSKYFLDLFTSETTRDLNIFEIDKVKRSAVKELFLFIYSGQITKMNNSEIKELINVADKLKVPQFKDLCTRKLLGLSMIEDNEIIEQFSKDFQNILEDEKFLVLSDIKFYIGDKTIQSHKMLLIARSSVFENLLSAYENETVAINLKDISFHIMKELLNFLYYGKIFNSINYPNFLSDLYIAACKYNIIGLKNIFQKSDPEYFERVQNEMVQTAKSLENLKKSQYQVARRALLSCRIEGNNCERFFQYSGAIKHLQSLYNNHLEKEHPRVTRSTLVESYTYCYYCKTIFLDVFNSGIVVKHENYNRINVFNFEEMFSCPLLSSKCIYCI